MGTLNRAHIPKLPSIYTCHNSQFVSYTEPHQFIPHQKKKELNTKKGNEAHYQNPDQKIK